jgi:hypothetical protein
MKNGHCAAFANTVHYRERRDDHGTTFCLSTSDFLFDHLAAPAVLSVLFPLHSAREHRAPRRQSRRAADHRRRGQTIGGIP